MRAGMNMDRFHGRHDAVSTNSGMEFSDIPKLVVSNGQLVRLIGDFASAWEHFVNTPNGPRPYYCDGPESDCPICQIANRLSFSDDPEKQELGRNLKAKEKFYFNALDRSPAGLAWHRQNKKTKLLTQSEKASSIGAMLFKAIGDVVKMRRQQGQPDDPNTFDIMLSKTGTGMKTKYSAQFTGIVTELTEDELAYEQWPVEQIAKITPYGDRESVARFVAGDGPAPDGRRQRRDDYDSDDDQPTAPSPSAAAARGPVQSVKPPQPAKPVAAPPPARPPQAAAPAPVKPPKLAVKVPPSEYQDTTPTEDADPSVSMVVPCTECGSDMQINMEDTRDLKCHSCGKVYLHPSKG